jgi:hypothetical protein
MQIALALVEDGEVVFGVCGCQVLTRDHNCAPDILEKALQIPVESNKGYQPFTADCSSSGRRRRSRPGRLRLPQHEPRFFGLRGLCCGRRPCKWRERAEDPEELGERKKLRRIMGPPRLGTPRDHSLCQPRKGHMGPGFRGFGRCHFHDRHVSGRFGRSIQWTENGS